MLHVRTAIANGMFEADHGNMSWCRRSFRRSAWSPPCLGRANRTLEWDYAVTKMMGRPAVPASGLQVLHGLYCCASAAAVPSYDPHDLILAGWSAFPSADAERLC
jgi:hypothetical protein